MRQDQLGRWCARLALVSAFSAAAVGFAAGAASAEDQLISSDPAMSTQEAEWHVAPLEAEWHVAPLEAEWH